MTCIPDEWLSTTEPGLQAGFLVISLLLKEYGSQPTSAFGTVGRMDAAVERTGMYSQRVPQADVG